VQNDPAYHLDVEGTHPENAGGCLAGNRKGFGKQIVQFFPIFETLFEFRSFRLELVVAQCADLRFKIVYFIDQGSDFLQIALVLAPEHLF